MERMISVEDIRRYLSFSEKIAELESSLYESGSRLSQEEFKIEQVMARQNKIRFDEEKNDLFRKQADLIIKTLAANYKDFGFDNNVYFDLVYNLMFLEYEKVDRLDRADGIADMLMDIGIDDHMQEKIKALIDHENGCHNCS